MQGGVGGGIKEQRSLLGPATNFWFPWPAQGPGQGRKGRRKACVSSPGEMGACDSEVVAAKEEVGGRSGRGWSTLPQWECGGEDAPPCPFLAGGGGVSFLGG